MSDRSAQDATTAVATEGPVSRPVLLTQAREAAGLHIAALAAALKVPTKKLEALEAGRYDELPDLVFARGLAASACRQLKVDPVPILQQIPAGVTPQLGDARMAINTPFKPASGVTPVHSVGWLSRPALLVALALVVGALVLVFLPDMTPPTGPVVNTPVGGTFPKEPTDPVPLAPEEGSTAPVSALVQSAAPVGLTSPGVVLPAELATAAVPLATQTTPVATVAVETDKVLAIRATGESWIEVTNGTGVVVIQRMLKDGDVVDFSAAPPYSVVVGRVDNAEVQVRGRTFDAKPFARNGVARFEVK